MMQLAESFNIESKTYIRLSEPIYVYRTGLPLTPSVPYIIHHETSFLQY